MLNVLPLQKIKKIEISLGVDRCYVVLLSILTTSDYDQ